MIDQLVSAATFGFGASFGRDLYRGAKKNPILLGIAAALLLCFGWRNLFLGDGHGVAYRIFVTFIGSILMIVAGAALLLGCLFEVLIYFTHDNLTIFWMISVIIIGVLSLIGINWGRRDRDTRASARQLEEKNRNFLHEAGLRDSGFDSNMLEDEEGNRLKLIEQTDDRIVFSVAGRRGLRAAITTDGGEMVAYTGIVKIS
jgi:hypothetical protein